MAGRGILVAVGTPLTGGPSRISVRAQFTHTDRRHQADGALKSCMLIHGNMPSTSVDIDNSALRKQRLKVISHGIRGARRYKHDLA